MLRTLLIYVVNWCGLLIIAIGNGALREKVYGARMTELSAHQLDPHRPLSVCRLHLVPDRSIPYRFGSGRGAHRRDLARLDNRLRVPFRPLRRRPFLESSAPRLQPLGRQALGARAPVDRDCPLRLLQNKVLVKLCTRHARAHR